MAPLRPNDVLRFFQIEIRGVALLLVLGTLGGVVAGFCGGLICGDFFAEREITRELIKAKSGMVNYRLDEDGKLPSKISGYIRSDCSWAGLKLGLPFGAAVGFLIGGLASWAFRTGHKPSATLKVATR